MLERGKISIRQFTILVALITVGDSILVLPSIPAMEAKQDAWIAGLAGLLIGLLFIYLYSVVGKLYPRMTIVEYSEKILGKWLGKAVSFFFLLYILFSIAAHLREIGDFMTTQFMPQTPIQAIAILFLTIIILGGRLGLETLARTGEIFFPWFILFFLTFVFFLAPQIDLEKILPIYENGFPPIIRGAIPFVSFSFLENVVFLMVLPYVNQVKEIRKSFLIGAILGGIVLIIIMILAILVLGADLTARNMYPSYSLAKKISIGNILERVEAILAIMWFLTTFLKITMYFYVMNLGFAQMGNLKEYKVLTLPLGLILIVLSLMISPNITYFNTMISKYWPLYDFTNGGIIPLLLLGVYTFRKKG